MNLANVKNSLIERLAENRTNLPIHVEAFCDFISPWQEITSPVNSSSYDGTYQSVAALGYFLASNPQDKNLVAQFEERVLQLSGRSYFPKGRTPRFEIDGIALLGIALGYYAINATLANTQWLSDCLNKSISALSEDTWEQSFARIALSLNHNDFSFEEVDRALSVSFSFALGKESTKEDRHLGWKSLFEHLNSTHAPRLAALQGVFEVYATALSRLPVHGAGIPELVELLEGLSQSMSHWTYETRQRVKNVTLQKWEIDHEYHVQNLLWTMLRPVFPDLVDEESLRKLGHTSPRADLGIPSLQAIVEVKYMRKRSQAELKKITDEVAADHSLYLRDNTGYSHLIVFIWDECRQTENYKTLIDGLESLAGIEKVIILPRPSKMERN